VRLGKIKCAAIWVGLFGGIAALLILRSVGFCRPMSAQMLLIHGRPTLTYNALIAAPPKVYASAVSIGNAGVFGNLNGRIDVPADLPDTGVFPPTSKESLRNIFGSSRQRNTMAMLIG